VSHQCYNLLLCLVCFSPVLQFVIVFGVFLTSVTFCYCVWCVSHLRECFSLALSFTLLIVECVCVWVCVCVCVRVSCVCRCVSPPPSLSRCCALCIESLGSEDGNIRICIIDAA